MRASVEAAVVPGEDAVVPTEADRAPIEARLSPTGGARASTMQTAPPIEAVAAPFEADVVPAHSPRDPREGRGLSDHGPEETTCTPNVPLGDRSPKECEAHLRVRESLAGTGGSFPR